LLYLMTLKTIKIDEKIKKKLDKLRIHPRQGYGEIINNLIEGK